NHRGEAETDQARDQPTLGGSLVSQHGCVLLPQEWSTAPRPGGDASLQATRIAVRSATMQRRDLPRLFAREEYSAGPLASSKKIKIKRDRGIGACSLKKSNRPLPLQRPRTLEH